VLAAERDVAEVITVERSEEAIARAAFSDRRGFDAIIAIDTLEHVADPRRSWSG